MSGNMTMQLMSVDIGDLHFDGREDGSVVIANRKTAGLVEMDFITFAKAIVILRLWYETGEDWPDTLHRPHRRNSPDMSSQAQQCGMP